MGNDSLNIMTKSYRDKALDTFIRGLNGDLPRLLGMKEPVDLPQALHLCLKLQNQNFRPNHIYNTRGIAPPQLPRRQNFEKRQKQKFYPHLAHIPHNNQQYLHQNNPQRPSKPQPRPEPMDVDQSMHSRHINYINKPHRNDLQGKRPGSILYPQQKKLQRTFHIDTEQVQLETPEKEYIEPTDIYFLA